MTRIKVISGGIASAGYDALCAILELEFLSMGRFGSIMMCRKNYGMPGRIVP
jgi:hypothetical protein